MGQEMATGAELNYNQGASAMQMAQTIFGDGVTVVGASYSGWSQSSAIYSNGDALAPGATPGDTGVILSTGRASHFTRSGGDPNRSTNTSTNTSGENNNPDFNAAAGTNTYDASYLDVSFIPEHGVMTMQFVFSSEEYPEFQNSVYQDFVGVWVNGQQAQLEVGNGDSDPGNINSVNNQNLFLDNTGDAFNTEMDGLTVTMTLTMNVIPGQVNTIRIGVADVSDSNYDSNLLIAANSVQTRLVAVADHSTIYPDGSVTMDILDNDINHSGATLTITHLNGIPVTAGSTITLATGQTVMLNADGTITVTGDGDVEHFNFTYTVTNGAQTDTGIVNVNAIPCFVAGTLIDTPYGERQVERLTPGDLVITRDNGSQEVRWVGERTVDAEGDFAPVLIRAGTYGAQRDLLVSPQHRILIHDSLSELLFGEREVLVAAKDLVDGRRIRFMPGGRVTYVHVMFDNHEVIYSEGLASESFLPGPQTTHLFEPETLNEIRAVFPELDTDTGEGYGPAARRVLRKYETELLLTSAKVA